MTDAGKDADRRGVELPPEALRDLIEDFVTRDGPDYGAVERGVEELNRREILGRGLERRLPQAQAAQHVAHKYHA